MSDGFWSFVTALKLIVFYLIPAVIGIVVVLNADKREFNRWEVFAMYVLVLCPWINVVYLILVAAATYVKHKQKLFTP